MGKDKPTKIYTIISLLIFIIMLFVTVYTVLALIDEPLGTGQTLLSFVLMLSLALTLFFGIGLLRHFTGWVQKSKLSYTMQTLLSVLLPFFIVPIFSNSAITHSQEKVFSTVKSELAPLVTYIEAYQAEYGKLPQSIAKASNKPATLKNIYYDHTPHNFILGTYIASLDIDGAQIYYNSRNKQWYQFHNDMYQYHKDKKERPESIEHYISFHNQPGTIASIIRKKNGVWMDPKEEAKKNSQDHLVNYTKSCEAGHGASCTAVGMRYGMGLDVAQSDAKALKYFTKACEFDDGNGCHYLADMYAQGKGVQKDIAKATKFYKKACALGSEKACHLMTN